MEKLLSYGALGAGALMAVVFVLDIALGIPFGGNPFLVGDILGLIASLLVAYLGYSAARDLK